MAHVRLGEMVRFVQAFGFRRSRVQGSHHICVHPDVTEPVQLQSVLSADERRMELDFLALPREHHVRIDECHTGTC